MKTLYWLPEVERGCNCIRLERVEWSGAWGIQFQPGNAVAGADGEPDPATFVPDADIPPRGRTVRDEADYLAWLGEEYAAPEIPQNLIDTLLRYLWRQHKGLRPAAPQP